MFKKILMICLSLTFIAQPNLYAKNKVIIKVFHAGSLSVPFAKIEKEFEEKYPNIDIRREASGSVKAIRKITELHKDCDVIAVADYSLIPKMLFGTYTDHVKLFAKNELVICYTNKSRYKNVINKLNWYNILSKSDVKWGFANPNDDPCGYRTLLSIGLASLMHKDLDMLKNLLGKYTNIKYEQDGNTVHFNTQVSIKTIGKKVFIRPKSVELLGLLESGAIDYAFEYKSVAKQHNLLYVDLPSQINLGDLANKKFYKNAEITLSNGKKIAGGPIVYGISVLKNSKHLKQAKLFEEFVTGEQGAKILSECSQIPIVPAKTIYAFNIQKCSAVYNKDSRYKIVVATGSPGELSFKELGK